MTLKEIAEMAGVSPSTVSRVLHSNGEKYASKEVRDRIWKIVQETQYTPNVNAQNLKKVSQNKEQPQKYRFACLFGRGKEFFDDQFFYSIYKAAEQEIYKNNGFICSSFALSQNEYKATLDSVKSLDVDGIIVLGKCSSTVQKTLIKDFKNIIFVSLNPGQMLADQVICDGKSAAESAVTYLHELGHKKIGYIGEIREEQRYIGYCNKMKELKLPFDGKCVCSTPLTVYDGYRNMKEFLEKKPEITSLFCCNDNVAVGAVRAILEKKLKIPEDISIISIDNTEMAQFTDPMLTTIHIPKEEMGSIAVQTLISRIQKKHKIPLRIEVPYRIIYRDSCCKR